MAGSRRWPYSLVLVLALVTAIWGLSRQPRLSSLPADFEPPADAFPLVVEGVTAATPEELRFVAESVPPGTSITLVPAAGEPLAVTLERTHATSYLAVTGVSGLLFWAVCAFVFAPRIRQPAVPTFFWILLLYGQAVMIGGVYFQRDPLGSGSLLGLVQLTCLSLLPVLFLQLTLIFPRRHPVRDRALWLLPALWSLAAATILWQALAFWRYFAAPGPATGAALGPPQRAADVVMIAVTVAGFAVLIRQEGRLALTRERKQVRWLLWGFAVGAAPYLLLRTLPQLTGASALLPVWVDRVFELAIPAAFVLAVVRHRFLDIDIVIRRSLIYGLLAAVTVTLIVAPVLLFAGRIEEPLPLTGRLVMVAGGLAAGLLFAPLRRILGRLVDRTFFKIAHDHDEALARFAGELGRATGQQGIAILLDGFLRARLGCPRQAVVIAAGREVCVAGDVATERGADLLEAAAGTPPRRTLARPGATSLPELEDAAFPAPWREGGFVIAQPLSWRDGTGGVLLLGPRETDRRFVEPDLTFLARCAEMAAAALERLTLVQAVAEEAGARRRLDELDRLKSDFLSRVAHDLRTPMTSIGWSVRNLRDGLAGELNEKQERYLGSIGSAVAHLDGLVANLLDISRLERAVIEIPCGPVPLAGVVAEAVAAVAPLAERRGIALRTAVEPGTMVVRAHPGRLAEVLVNLLDNAIKYSPDGGEVTIDAAREPDGRVRLQVRDQGAGLRDVADPFARFSQGEPSPHAAARGFGLGLFIVRQYVERMDGEVSGTNHPGGGAVFTCLLRESDGEWKDEM